MSLPSVISLLVPFLLPLPKLTQLVSNILYGSKKSNILSGTLSLLLFQNTSVRTGICQLALAKCQDDMALSWELGVLETEKAQS